VIKRTGNKRLLSPLPCAVNQLWVGDVTYLWQQKKWWYLAVVMDVYSRKIIGWSLETHRKKELTIKALRHALQTRQPKSNMLFHSDRGSEYAAQAFREVLKQYGITPSMNRPGHCTDNAHIESFSIRSRGNG
jgi:transposase InsO family protein